MSNKSGPLLNYGILYLLNPLNTLWKIIGFLFLLSKLYINSIYFTLSNHIIAIMLALYEYNIIFTR